MTATAQTDVRGRFAGTINTESEAEPKNADQRQQHEADAVRDQVLRLSAERSQARSRGDVLAVADLTRRLETGWQHLRLAPVVVEAADGRPALRSEQPLDRYLIGVCEDAPASAMLLADFAHALRHWTASSDPAEADDLPDNRELARQLRARGIQVSKIGGNAVVTGLQIVADQDETARSPDRDSTSSRR